MRAKRRRGHNGPHQALIAALTPQGMSPNQTPSPDAVAAAMAQGPGRYGQGYSPDPSRPLAPDPAPRVSKDAAKMLFRAHDMVQKENPELAKVLWQKIQPFTGDF